VSYLYYPGCSLKSTGRAYEESMLAVFAALHADIRELEDWNCCGATAYMSISELKAFALSARNFALAEKQESGSGEVNVVVPCAACYLGLNKARRYLSDHPDVRAIIDIALRDAGLAYKGIVRIRHPLDVLINDVGPDTIRSMVDRPLEGLKVACYYGCQIIRPYADFDDQHNPRSMDDLMIALGADVIDWPLKVRCCGGSLTGTVQEVGLRLSYLIVREARKRGADVIVTACPLCQFNLECYQPRMNGLFDDDLHLPTAYFTQLIGLAFGLSPKKLGINRLFVPVGIPETIGAGEGGRHASR
jgi:heterodisulfide reductase subunit B